MLSISNWAVVGRTLRGQRAPCPRSFSLPSLTSAYAVCALQRTHAGSDMLSIRNLSLRQLAIALGVELIHPRERIRTTLHDATTVRQGEIHETASMRYQGRVIDSVDGPDECLRGIISAVLGFHDVDKSVS